MFSVMIVDASGSAQYVELLISDLKLRLLLCENLLTDRFDKFVE